MESSSDELKPLKVWQFQELSLQAAEKIMNMPAETALDTLIHIAQNFPMQVRNFLLSVIFLKKLLNNIFRYFSYKYRPDH